NRPPTPPTPPPHEEARKEQPPEHLQVHADDEVEHRIDDRALVDRLGHQLGIKRWVAAEPQPVDNGIGHERQKYPDVGYDERDGPGELRALQAEAPHLPARPRGRN